MRASYPDMFTVEQSDSERDASRDSERQNISGFLEHWGWEYNVDLCRQATGLTENHIYTEWNVIELMNKLSYLKDKGKFEIALNGSK